MENKKLVSDLIYLRGLLDSRIDNFITETALRSSKVTNTDLDNLEKSIEYVLEERFGFMKS